MSKWQKELQRMRANPKHVRFDELDRVLLRLGFVKRMKKGSHATYTIANSPPITIPYDKPFIRANYVRMALAIIEMYLDE